MKRDSIRRPVPLGAAVAVLSAIAGPTAAAPILPAIPQGTVAVTLKPIATGLGAPDYAISAPGDASRLFVVEQSGLLRVVQNGQMQAAPALDIQSRVARR